MSGTIRALCHRAHQSCTPRDVALDRHLPDCEDILKEVIWAFSDFVRDNRGVYDPEARYPAGNPWYPVTGQF
ncbi:hypothetical protein K3E25_002476 [Escherichia coli]|nr:hypothetical protein [Escherichia coli]EEZ8898814.1 hypothetical protein [Escherichia coli O104]EFB7147470.1 hypothetical protein [Escherichia coli]EFC7945562.1 hypothetical protein [Escherichia coli]EFF0493636.1 hypothetical protein [Escherichia coli]EFF2263555.1 hypothetical protein [Escherichia coli]